MRKATEMCIRDRDWERRKAEFYDMVIDTEYGGMPPQPEVFKVDKVCMGFNRDNDIAESLGCIIYTVGT